MGRSGAGKRKSARPRDGEESARSIARPSGTDDDASDSFDLTTKDGFEGFRDDVLGRVPESVRSRFREGGFCKWGKDWLPVLELGPFDVEPGTVRDMWLKMFEKVRMMCECAMLLPSIPGIKSSCPQPLCRASRTGEE